MAKAFTGLDDPRVIAAREAFEDTGSYSDAARLVGTSRTSIKRALEFYEKNISLIGLA